MPVIKNLLNDLSESHRQSDTIYLGVITFNIRKSKP